MLTHGVYNTSPSNQLAHQKPMHRDGPLIYVALTLPVVLASYLANQHVATPAPVVGRALIDTGASHSSFDASVISSLGISPTGVQIPVGTGAGQVVQDTYHIALSVPSHNYNIELPQVAGSDMRGQTTNNGEPIIGVLGRDFLMNFVLIYNGNLGEYTLAS